MLQRYKKAKANIREKVLNTNHLLEETAVFSMSKRVHEPHLDAATIEIIKQRYLDWFESWVKDDLELISK